MQECTNMFSRNALFFTQEQSSAILNAEIAVAGVGGLGCVVAEILSRLCIKRLVLIDNGVVDEPDIGRQSLFDSYDIGRKKIDAASEKLKRINPSIDIAAHFLNIEKGDIAAIINDADGVVDCLDNYNSRFALEKNLKDNQFMVHGGVEADYGQIATIMPYKTAGLSEIYANIETNNKIIAVSTVSVYVIASLMAQETLNNILGKPQLLNKMLVVELGDFTFRMLDLNI